MVKVLDGFAAARDTLCYGEVKDMIWAIVFVAVFLLIVGIGIGSGLDTHYKRRLSQMHAREVRERRRTFL